MLGLKAYEYFKDERVAVHVKWAVGSVFFSIWLIIYVVIFIFAAILSSDISFTDAILCKVGTADCIGSKCEGIALSMLLLAISGICLFSSMTALSLSLWKQLRDEAKATIQDTDPENEEQVVVRSRRGGVDNSVVAPNAVAQTPGVLADDKNENVRPVSHSLDSTASPDTHDGDVELELPNNQAAAAETEQVERPAYRPCLPFKCVFENLRSTCFRRCQGLYVDPTEFELKIGPNNKFDKDCCVVWSTYGAQCCMFPWFVMVFTSTITVLGASNNTQDNDGYCDVKNENLKPNETAPELSIQGVQLTWFAVLFTWVVFGVFGVYALVKSFMHKMNLRRQARMQA
mmetsp:Transcript_2664/g.5179  ORF Transcript_2664/g.5179 Transcript_2664/m.5179 type:complete len:344 (+) Transcript_2664:67-1098(+)